MISPCLRSKVFCTLKRQYHFSLKPIMRRMMKEDMYDDPTCWNRRTWEEDQQKLKNLENRVNSYLLDINRRYKVSHFQHSSYMRRLNLVIITFQSTHISEIYDRDRNKFPLFRTKPSILVVCAIVTILNASNYLLISSPNVIFSAFMI